MTYPGENSGIVPDRSLNVLYRTTLNTLGKLTEAGLTQSNTTGNAQKTANTRLGTDTPTGILAGSVVAVGTESGTIVAAVGDTGFGGTANTPVGIALNSAVGYPYESSSGVASGKVPYIHGAGSVVATDIYETRNKAAAADLVYASGDKLYASENGLLTNEAGAEGTVIGVCLSAPSSSDPFMVVQMRI